VGDRGDDGGGQHEAWAVPLGSRAPRELQEYEGPL
jgi:hypothetical protein